MAASAHLEAASGNVYSQLPRHPRRGHTHDVRGRMTLQRFVSLNLDRRTLMRNSFKIILLSTLLAPVAIHADASDMGASTPAVRVSTGVVAPAVINSGDFSVS